MFKTFGKKMKMQLVIAVVFAFYFCAKDVKCSPTEASFIRPWPESTTSTSTTTTPPRSRIIYTISPTTPPSTVIPVPTSSAAIPEDDYLQNISIQDILSLGIDENDKIQKRIVNATIEFSSNYDNYKRIILTTKNYSLPQNFIQINTTQGSVRFHSIKVSESYSTTFNRPYETIVGCDLPGSAMIQVSLPTEISILAQITVTSSEEIVKVGSITVQFTNSILTKYLNVSTDMINSENDFHSKIIYDESSVRITMDNQFHKLVYKQVENFLGELESSMGVFLTTQFDEEIAKRNISFSSSCSKLLNMKYDQKKINSLFNNRINYLYVIPNVKLDTWKSVTLKAGPIVIQGLSNFISSETVVVDVDNFSTSSNYNKTLAVRIETGELKGKFEWHYNSKKNDNNRALLFFFSIDHIQFESKISRHYDENSRYGYQYDQYGRRREFQVRGPSIDVQMGEMQIKTAKSKSCEYEEAFVNVVLSEYLKSIIIDSLKNTLLEEINTKRSSFVDSFDST